MKDATRATSAGRTPEAQAGAVNPPVYHASTIVFPTLEAMRETRSAREGEAVTYGVHGTPGTFAFEEAVAALEGGYRTRLCNSGLQAVTAPLLCLLSPGDHLLMVDSCYAPTRRFCDGMLRRMGVETSYYDPLIGGGIAELIRENTRVVFVESPGSVTFEVQDIPAIAEAAHADGAWVVMDNTWATPLFFKPFSHGVDVSVQAVTKYISGHSDLVMGCVTATEAAYEPIQRGWAELGLCGSPDDTFLALRGLRSLPARMRQHQENGLALARWLMEREEVAEVIHPALEHDPGHALWKRDFAGAASLFSFVLDPSCDTEARLSALCDRRRHFGLGYSWGGFESLMTLNRPERLRTATPWPRPGRPAGPVIRVHVGLDDPEDLIADLAEGFDAMHAA